MCCSTISLFVYAPIQAPKPPRAPRGPVPPRSEPPAHLVSSSRPASSSPPGSSYQAQWALKKAQHGRTQTGWFTKCQDLCAAVLDNDMESASFIAAQHWAADH